MAISDGVVLAGSFRGFEEAGAAFVFVEPEGGWSGAQTESAKLLPSDEDPEAGFGLDVALEGRVAVVSSPDAVSDPGANGVVYVFEEPLDSNYVAADKKYAEKITGYLEERIKNYGMECGFPDYIGSRRIDRTHLGQTTLHNFLI